MAGKKKAEPPVTLEALRDTCVAIAFSVKRGEMSATNARAMTDAIKMAIYAEQTRLSRDRADAKEVEALNTGTTLELSQDAKDRLDQVISMLNAKKEG